MIKKIVLSLLFAFFLVGTASGACGAGDYYETINSTHLRACNCTQAYVTFAIDNSTSGQTVLVPAGTCIWTETLYITDSIKLIGDGIGSTVINSTTYPGISYVVSGNVPFEFSGFTVKGNNKINEAFGLFCRNTNNIYPLYDFKIHNNRFEGWRHGVKPHGMIYGVIYENEFFNVSYTIKPLGGNLPPWQLYPGLENIGTLNYLYIENNTMCNVTTIVLSSGEGARWVFRYNEINLTGFPNYQHFLDAHGDTLNYGVVANEVYENEFVNGTSSYRLHHFRGGTGIIFNNTVDKWAWIAMTEDYANGSCIDPAFPESLSINNAYLWENRNTDTGILQIISDNCTPCGGVTDVYECIEENVSWWDDAPHVYGGTDADDTNFFKDISTNRTGTCADDECYWETDTEELYRCDGNNNWISIYTPFDYPHPLISGIPGISIITPSNNLRTVEKTISFNVSSIDSGNLSNVTLWGNWSGGWHANETININESYNETTFTKTLPVGTYVWNAKVYDEDGNTDWANLNYTFEIGTTPAITSWQNNKTNNNSLDITINVSEEVLFNVTCNQTVTTWGWDKDDVDQSYNYDNITLNWSSGGLKHVVVDATNANGTSNSITWNITVGGVTYTNPSHNTTASGNSCLFSIQYNDDTALHPNGQYIFATNNSGYWVNESAVNFTSTPETISTVKALNGTQGTVVGYRWYANDSTGNSNDTEVYTLTVSPNPEYFSYYKIITINQSMVNHSIGTSNYQLLVSFTDTNLSDHAQADGDDITFFNADNVTQLPHENELWNSTNGELITWVGIDDITNVSHIVMYYGNNSIVNSEDASSVWADYLAVYHMTEINATDSTGDYSGTESGGVTFNSAGQINGNLDFDGDNDHIETGSDIVDGLSQVTYCAWVKPSVADIAAYEYIMSEHSSVQLYRHSSQYYMFYVYNETAGKNSPYQGVYTDTDWHHLCGVYDGSTVDIFVDGIGRNTPSSFTGTIRTSSYDFRIATEQTATKNWNGSIDEPRILDIALSRSYIETDYNNSKYPSLFISVGNEQSQVSTNASAITSWQNNKTNNNSLDITINVSEEVLFNATCNQTVTTWGWDKDDVDQGHNYDNITLNWSYSGLKHVVVDATNANGTSNSITWNVTVSGTADTKFEYWSGSAWTEGLSTWMLWFQCYFWCTECANAEQSSGQPSLKITNNGTGAGTPKVKLNESTPDGITIWIDNDNTYAGAVQLTNSYQAVGASLTAGENVTLWSWCDLEDPSPWVFETHATVE